MACLWQWLSVCYVQSSVVLVCLLASFYWNLKSNRREWNWVMSMCACVACRWWDQRGGFHLFEIVRWLLGYVVGKPESRSFLLSCFIDISWLDAVRISWFLWVHICVCVENVERIRRLEVIRGGVSDMFFIS
jgi:hypothetical protein